MTARKPVGPSPNGGGPVPSLTDRELVLLMHMALGATYETAARPLNVADRTASWMAQQVMRKLGAKNITNAVYIACQLGILVVDPPRPRDSEVAAAPSVRLLRSLMAEGFSMSFIAERMAMGQPELSVLMNRKHITPAMEARVRRAFADLAGRDPLALGVHPRGRSRALNRARVEGWEIVGPLETEQIRRAIPHAA